LSDYNGPERRHKARIYEPFPVKVRGVERQGQAFEEDTLVENLSASGVYLHLPLNVEQGAKLFLVIQFLGAQSSDGIVARVAVRGVVMRVEPKADGSYGLAVAIWHHRFL